MRTLSVVALALAALVALQALAAASAHAGVYTVYSCRTPSGAAAVVDGWGWTYTRKRSTSGTLTNRCPSGPLELELRPNAVHEPDDEVSLYFRAPTDTEIRAYSIYRSVQLGSRYNFWRWDLGVGVVERCHTTQNNCSRLGDPSRPLASENLIRTADRSGVTGVHMKLTCGEDDTKTTTCKSANPAARLQIHRAELTLFDSYAPKFDAPPSGSLVGGSPLKGAHGVTIKASDRGGGVYRAQLEVDGRTVKSAVLNSNGGLCKEPFIAAKPCPSSTTGTLTLDTTELSDGDHSLRVVITDATGTNRADWGPARIVVANRAGGGTGGKTGGGKAGGGTGGGTGGGIADPACETKPRVADLDLDARFVARAAKRGGAAVLRTEVHQRRQQRLRLRGRLSSRLGAPIAGARVCVVARPLAGGATAKRLADVTTDGQGRFELVVPAGPSRELVAIHRTAAGSVVAKARVRVDASVTLTASPTRLRNGQRVRLAGRLRHGPMPRGGAFVELQARRGSSWQTFATTRTDRKGRFSYRYRFTSTPVARRYELRALVDKQAAYPYERGASRKVGVLVRP